MESKAEWREYAGKTGQAIAGFLCSGISILGFYPFLTGFFAASCLWKRQSFFLYVGIVAGLSYFMSYTAVLKYVVLLLAIWASIKVYRYANRRCSGPAAGLIAGICTMAVNFSGTLLSWGNRQTLLPGASEAVLAASLTCGFHYLMELCRSLHLAAFESQEERMTTQAADGRMEAFANAVSGLAEAVNAVAYGMDAGAETGNTAAHEMGAGAQKVNAAAYGMDSAADGELGAGGAYAVPLYDGAVMIDGGQEEKYPESIGEDTGLAWHRRLQENRAAVVQQLSAMVDLLKNWSRKEQLLDDRLKLLMTHILFETREKGLLVEHLHILADDGGRRMVQASVASKWEGGIPSRNYAKALSRAMHGPMRLAKDTQSVISREWVTITAYEDTIYYTLPGIAMHKRDNSVMTGDNFTMFDLDSGMHYIGLSDGMGSGFAANQESELVVDLLERLIRAGFDEETTISLMNSAFVLQGEDCSFSTLDLAKVDLYSGDVEILKVGAAASFLKHKDEVEELSEAALPAGAKLDEKPGVLHQQAESGDFLVMVTDGVLDCFQTEDAAEHFAHMIAGVRTDNAGVLARTLLEKTLRVAGGQARDDMTILVTGIWEKK